MYLAWSASGEGRSQMGAIVPVGINRVDVWVDTPLENWTHVLVYVRSPLFEQTTPVAQAISDTYLTVGTTSVLSVGRKVCLKLGNLRV
ncbi:unnamed protein product [Cladocopium goreaui]|uniref:Subtilisin n=1 Tax=Cladocopium goreaui TaxID=2562237 RepID=A0A9P1BQ32_9DINO|nr:unnamed protein product [Cladocopium goreaui]